MAIIRQLLRGAGFGALTAGAGTAIWADVTRTSGEAAKRVVRNRWSGAWAKGLLTLFGIELFVTGNPGAGNPQEGGRVVIANHRSIIDIAVLLQLFGGAMVSRADLETWPIIGPAARAAGTIFVDRASRKSGAHAINKMIEHLERGDTICLFPEGTTYVDDEVRPFKPGACVAATRAGVPVVPVALVYPLDSGAAFGGESFGRHLARLAATPHTRVGVHIGAAMHARPGERVEDFSERCRQEVARLLAVGRSGPARG